MMREGVDDAMLSWTHDWGHLLRGARQVAGISLAGLSERTGLSRGYLSKLESGQDGARNPSRATLVALARALPSFRPLAYQLEPLQASTAAPAPAQRDEQLRPAPHHPARVAIQPARESDENGDVVARPIQLGWRELEALVAFLALERAAMTAPITVRLIARATDRPGSQTQETLEGLAASGALRAVPPSRPGDAPTFARGPAFDERLGLSKLGDALLLAAALLGQAAPRGSAGYGE